MSLTTAQKQILHSCPGCQHGIANHDGLGCATCSQEWDDVAGESRSCRHSGRTIETTYAAVAALIDAAVMEARAEPPTLLPVEALALTVGLSQIEWGDTADSDAATRCILALARITGQHDWTKDAS